MTILNHTLGFPRVGLRRELKKAQESYWAGNSTREELLAVGRELRARHWDQQKMCIRDRVSVEPGVSAVAWDFRPELGVGCVLYAKILVATVQ